MCAYASVWIVKDADGQPVCISFLTSDGYSGSCPCGTTDDTKFNAAMNVLKTLGDRGISDIRHVADDPRVKPAAEVGDRVRLPDRSQGLVVCINKDKSKAHVEVSRYNTMVVRVDHLTVLDK